MAEPIWVKLSGIIEDSAENDLAKERKNKRVIIFGQPCISGPYTCKGKTKQAGSELYGQKGLALASPRHRCHLLNLVSYTSYAKDIPPATAF